MQHIHNICCGLAGIIAALKRQHMVVHQHTAHQHPKLVPARKTYLMLLTTNAGFFSMIASAIQWLHKHTIAAKLRSFFKT